MSGSVPVRTPAASASTDPASGPWSTTTSRVDQEPQEPFSRIRIWTVVPAGVGPDQSTPTRENAAVVVAAVTTAGAMTADVARATTPAEAGA